MRVFEVRDGTTFVRLPLGLRRVIEGGCQCPYCVAHPYQVPTWDTLATDGDQSAWTVHFPGLGMGNKFGSSAL